MKLWEVKPYKYKFQRTEVSFTDSLVIYYGEKRNKNPYEIDFNHWGRDEYNYTRTIKKGVRKWKFEKFEI